MVNDKKKKQKSENLKTTSTINTKWTIDLVNTSDIGYPDEEDYIPNQK